jgi:hypothetical protein
LNFVPRIGFGVPRKITRPINRVLTLDALMNKAVICWKRCYIAD